MLKAKLLLLIGFSSFSVCTRAINNPHQHKLMSPETGKYILRETIKINLSKAQHILNAYDKLYVLMPGIVYSETIKSGKNYKILNQVYKADYTFGLSIPATIYIQKINPNEVQYHLLKSNKIHALSGEILLQKMDNQHVLIIDKIDIDPIVPFFLRSLFFKRFRNQLALSDIKMLDFFRLKNITDTQRHILKINSAYGMKREMFR